MRKVRRHDGELLFAAAFCGGALDAAAFCMDRTFAGHITGNCVLCLYSLMLHDTHGLLLALAAILGFCLGTAAGFRCECRRIQSFLLFLLPLLIAIMPGTHVISIGCAGFASGWLNGMVSCAYGKRIGASYITGSVTALLADLTSAPRMPQILRDVAGPSGFISGAAAGVTAWLLCGDPALLLPVLPAFLLLESLHS